MEREREVVVGTRRNTVDIFESTSCGVVKFANLVGHGYIDARDLLVCELREDEWTSSKILLVELELAPTAC